jgi:hypothetical protein
MISHLNYHDGALIEKNHAKKLKAQFIQWQPIGPL